jgi:general secretion pathway protein G
MNKNKNKGFTLIELLVVIAIIGVLSSIVIASISSARVKSRDTQRISDLRQIRTALEMYRDDNGKYPPSSCGYGCNDYFYSYNSSWNTFQTYLAPYIKLPKDPVNTYAPWVDSTSFSYTYGNVSADGSSYDLTTRLETENHPLSCKFKNYRFYMNNTIPWCTSFGGSYSDQIYEASE